MKPGKGRRKPSGPRLVRALARAHVIHTLKEHGAVSLYSPTFWHTVFVLVFGEAPTDNDDKRWDLLLHPDPGLNGLRINAKLRGTPLMQPKVRGH